MRANLFWLRGWGIFYITLIYEGYLHTFHIRRVGTQLFLKSEPPMLRLAELQDFSAIIWIDAQASSFSTLGIHSLHISRCSIRSLII